ncbi:PhnD/SsuA/transferrin family substrate-binding protein [Nonomuraea fuscirosea]
MRGWFLRGCDGDHILIDKGKLKAGQVKVVWKSAPIPTSPVAIRDALPNKLRSTLIKTFTQDANKRPSPVNVDTDFKRQTSGYLSSSRSRSG